ncbi:rRNA maturation RNase YbeY [Geofilum rubicundum]|uniref:Endoribonuclease YbeY n=1 Tax=Geofilum rubicundum JCM 15548 TaxID=1236989 RepID=A0A0E9M0D8_9BACT|nr:rRNA maturation RNase YbeY [Geofilum rubicundum]GAO31292.1 metal-dependent hydrolase [Geofilum rubicundum JCM 15548]
MESNIEFFNEDTGLPQIDFPLVSKWIVEIIEDKLMSCGPLSIIFCSDDYLLNINQQYLNHDYHTDIITFNYSSRRIISGDLFISTDTVRTNADIFKVSFTQELVRVIFHGILHLLGWDDHSEGEKLEMRNMENFWLHKFSLQ